MKMSTERGACSVDGVELREDKITYSQTIGERAYIVTDVPAQVCPLCGEQYLAPDTVDALQRLIEHGRAPKKTITVPVYEFSQWTSP